MISKEEVIKLAKLARLDFSDDGEHCSPYYILLSKLNMNLTKLLLGYFVRSAAHKVY